MQCSSVMDRTMCLCMQQHILFHGNRKNYKCISISLIQQIARCPCKVNEYNHREILKDTMTKTDIHR